jgi:D-alanyl-D-alanine dipeptidase
LHRTVIQLISLAFVCACLNAAEAPPAIAAPTAPTEEALPDSPQPAISSLILDAQLKSVRRYLLFADCKVAPLTEIDESEAQSFEKGAETAVDVDDLTPDAAHALDTFEEMVTAAGGTIELKSAYRPPTYQAHLHEVWVKWVKELRGNRSGGCRALREEVGAEFARHQLLIRQQPVPASDHALGLAFDAAVAMPRGARLNGKRVTVDKLAALAGITRPNSRRDPVHFKLLPERAAAISYVHPPPPFRP